MKWIKNEILKQKVKSWGQISANYVDPGEIDHKINIKILKRIS